jgi:hypothetical protein
MAPSRNVAPLQRVDSFGAANHPCPGSWRAIHVRYLRHRKIGSIPEATNSQKAFAPRMGCPMENPLWKAGRQLRLTGCNGESKQREKSHPGRGAAKTPYHPTTCAPYPPAPYQSLIPPNTPSLYPINSPWLWHPISPYLALHSGPTSPCDAMSIPGKLCVYRNQRGDLTPPEVSPLLEVLHPMASGRG